MEERMNDAFAGTEHLTVIGRRLHPGGTAPDFCLNYLDLVDMAVHTVRLSDSAGMVRLLSMVNSLERQGNLMRSCVSPMPTAQTRIIA